MSPAWQIPAPDPDSVVDTPPPPLASLHYLGGALRRGWRTWAALALVGFVLGLVFPFLRPPSSTGTTTLMLAHEQGTDPAQAMATDVSILRTRTVAAQVIERLGLDMDANTLQSKIDAVPITSDVIMMSVPDASDEAALTLVSTLSDAYLAFRAEQVKARSDALIAGNNDRIAAFQSQAAELSTQYNTLSAGGPHAQDRAADVLSLRTQVLTQISDLQQTNETSALDTTTLIAASHVLDRPSIVPLSPVRAYAFPAVSGLIGGLGLGIGIVVLRALVSTRLRTREEVALAVGAPVRFSVGRIRGRWLGRRVAGSARALEVLSHGLETACARPDGGKVKVAVGTLDNARDVELIVGTVAARLSRAGRSVFVVDLSKSGRLERAVSGALAHDGDQRIPAAAPVAFRPDGVPSIARGPLRAEPSGASDLAVDEPRRAAWDAADVVITLTDVDPGVGMDDLVTWADSLVLVVTSGRSSAERLRTTGELVRSAGLDLQFVLLLGSDKTDESFGSPEALDPTVSEPRAANR